MDPSERLLDLLNKPNKAIQDKERLLALFAPQTASSGSTRSAVMSPQVQEQTPHTPTTRNGNASDLLATLMGSTSPRSSVTPQSRAAESASLLSTLMGTSNQATPSSPAQNPSRAPSSAQQPYADPRHDYLAAGSVSQSRPETSQKPFFETRNPFDELEAHGSSANLSSTVTASAEPKEDRLKLTSDTPSQAPGPNLQNTNSPEQKRNLADPPIPLEPTSWTDPSARQGHLQQTPRANAGSAYRIPPDASSVFKIPSSNPVSQFFSEPTPVTKMFIKHDPLNRNIIAASQKYFAYPVQKEGAPHSIRVVDQDNGETTLLEGHATRVISLGFARLADSDGINALLSTDANSNVILWSVSSALKVHKIFEVAGPSDSSHKSKAKWNSDGNYFGISITSRIYVFDYRSIAVANKPSKIKLHPDARHCLCICKADKAIKDFSFSADHTTICGADKLGNVRLWILDSNGKTINAAATITTGERALWSANFVGPRHIVVGTLSNESLILVDLQAAKNSQELRLPTPNNKDPYFMNSKLTFLSKANMLVVSNEKRQGLYFIRLQLPSTSGTTSKIIASLSAESSHIEAAGSFSALTEFGGEDADNHKLLSYACTASSENIDCFLAHESGYTLYTLERARIEALLSGAQALESSAITKLPSIGGLVTKSALRGNDQTAHGPSSPELEPIKQTPGRSNKKAVRPVETPTSGVMTVEPRTAEIASRIEAALKSTITTEFSKSTSALKVQIDSLQKEGDVRQEAILRLVSETLSKNTTKVLKSAIHDVVEQSVLPALKELVHSSVSSQLHEAISSSLKSVVATEIVQTTQVAIDRAFSDCGIVSQLNTATSSMTNDLNMKHKHMEQSLAGALVRLDAQILERQERESEKLDSVLQKMDMLEHRIAAMTIIPPVVREAAHTRTAQAQMVPQPPAQQHMTHSSPFTTLQQPPSGVALASQSSSSGEDYSKYHDLIMDFVTKTQRINAGDFDGVPFVRQFLLWQPDRRVRDGVCKSLGTDQLQLLAFVHALASELKEEDAYNRATWISSALTCLDVTRDSRLEVLGPRLLGIIRANLSQAREQSSVNSQYRHILETVLAQMASQ